MKRRLNGVAITQLTDTPFMTNVKRGRTNAVFTEWETDSLAPASGTNAKIEGDDAATDTASPTTRFGPEPPE